MQALILCAGEGSRLRPLTQIIPKPLVSVGGVPMVLRQIQALKAAGISEFVLNTAHGAGILEAALGDGSAWGVKIRYSHEGDCAAEALETLGGIARALPLLTAGGEEHFIVAAGDIVTDYDYRTLIARAGHLKEEGCCAHLVLVPNPSYHQAGDMTLTAEGRVSRRTKTHTFASFGLYSAELFRDVAPVRAKLFPWLFNAIDRETVSGEIYEGLWLNVGDFDELARAQACCSAN